MPQSSDSSAFDNLVFGSWIKLDSPLTLRDMFVLEGMWMALEEGEEDGGEIERWRRGEGKEKVVVS